MQGAAGKDAKGSPISALGHPRPYGQINRLLHAGAVRSRVRPRRETVAVVGWSGRPGLPGEEVPRGRTVVSGRRASTASTSITTTSSMSPAMARPAISTASIRGRRTSATIRTSSNSKPDGTFVYQIGTAGAKGPEQQRHQRRRQRHAGAVTGRPIWSSIRRRTSCTSPTVTATGAC